MRKEKSLEYYLNLNYPYTIEEEKENGKTVYVAEIPDLPGCGTHGNSLKEVRKNLEEAKILWIEESWKRNLPIPEPSYEYSGRILLRIPPALHGRLNKQARKEGVSLNQFIRNQLEAKLDQSNILERLEKMERAIRDLKRGDEPITTISGSVPNLTQFSAKMYIGPYEGGVLGTGVSNLQRPVSTSAIIEKSTDKENFN